MQSVDLPHKTDVELEGVCKDVEELLSKRSCDTALVLQMRQSYWQKRNIGY